MIDANSKRLWSTAWLLLACGIAGCGGTGSLTVLLEPEDTITDGIEPGTDVENTRDGWTVSYDNFIVAVGNVGLDLTGGGETASDPAVYVVDLTQAPASGLPLWSLTDLTTGRWDFNYSTPSASGAMQHESVTAADFGAMQSGGLTYLIRGTISKPDGTSCPPTSLAMPPPGATSTGMNAAGDACFANTSISFELAAPAATHFGPCEIDGVPGVTIGGGSQTVAATIHGDHLWFNGFPEGDESGTLRLVQYMADSDLNVDGAVTQEELQAIAPSELAEIDSRYQLGGSPITPLDTMWDYVVAQLKTQGHFQGEGECPFN